MKMLQQMITNSLETNEKENIGKGIIDKDGLPKTHPQTENNPNVLP